MKKTSVIVKIYQLSFRVFICAFHPNISLFFFFSKFLLFIPIFCQLTFFLVYQFLQSLTLLCSLARPLLFVINFYGGVIFHEVSTIKITYYWKLIGDIERLHAEEVSHSL